MPTRPQQQRQRRQRQRQRQPHRPPSKQLLQIREEGGGSYVDSKTPFLRGAPSWSPKTSPSATAAIDGCAGGPGVTASFHRGSGAEMTSADDGDGGDSDEGKRIAAKLSRARHSPQHPRQSRRHLRMSPRVTSACKAKSGDQRRASSSGSGLDRAAAAAVLFSTASLARSPQARVTSSPAVLGGHVTYYGPPSSRSLSDTDGNEADTQKNQSSCSSSSCLAAAHTAPGSEPSSPAARVSDCGGSGGRTAFSIPGSANDDARWTTAGCKPEAAISRDGESGSRAHASPLAPGTTTTTPLTYAAVASSSLHGKRLPKSRVSFSQWRKRVCCSSSASIPNTIDSANTSPGASSTTAVVFLNTFPSTRLTLTTPLAAATASTPRATGKSTPISTPSVDSNTADGDDGKASAPSGDEHDCASGGPQHFSASAAMPPLPPSVHRHQPTHLILQLPHAPLLPQARNTPDSDDDMVCDCSPRTAGTSSIAAAANDPSSPVVLPPKSSGTATAAAAPTLPFSAAEVTSAMGVRMPGVQTGEQQRRQQLNALKPVMSPPYMAFSPTTPPHGGAKSGPLLKVSATAAATAGKGVHRVPSAASLFNAAEILPGLFLGAYADATNTEALAAHGISLVINCAYECPVTPAMVNNNHHVRYAQCPLRDHSDEVIAPFFTPVTRIIHEQLHRREINHQRMARRAATSAPGVHVNDSEDHEVQERMLWAWTDEAENVWVAQPSFASPSLPVGGQPSFKESKRETPRTPSSTRGLGARFGDGAVCSSTITSCSPSPIPGGNATFPPLAVTPITADPVGATVAETSGATTAAAAAVPGSADVSSAAQNGNNVCTNTLFNTVPAPTFSTTFTEATSFTATTAPPPEASAITALPASASPPSPLTVVDPRDCGGVLVCCRMGVSRSATFIIAYLILYGCTLAPLDDTASLFAHFLERERRIIEEAGGLTFFTDSNGGVSNTSSQALATAPACPGRGSRCANGALTPHGSAGVNGVQPFVQNLLASSSPRTLRRSAMIPVSPLLSAGGGGCVAGSLTTPLSENPSTISQQRLRTGLPATQIELASRACQACYLLHLRERRVQQKTWRRLLISEQQQQQQQQQLSDQQDEEPQMMTLSASRMAAREEGQGCSLMGSVEDNSNFEGDSSAMASVRSDGEHQEEQQHHYHRHVFCALPSSAPVPSYRSARGSRTMTLLEAAYSDERVDADDGVDEEEDRQEEDAARTAVGQRSENLAAVSAATTPTQMVRDKLPTHKVCVAAAEAAPTTPNHSTVASALIGDGGGVYETPLALREQQQQQQAPLRSSCRILSPQPHMKGLPHSDLSASASTFLPVSFTSSGGGEGGSAFGGTAPAMTYREAFDAVKRQKADVNPNIGFILALRELAGGGDFSFSTSF
ncbi:phosphatase-like protein [Leishmania mexicana MHOM/GT/2001/U1103]|uniref:Phosphatase-like protein n=1 Tax=Leishmania mexicana (strain MHOM/GT/2001/U1103) TaxID=929439 RepID=E9AKH8_LEIMU|nr:phosphatase-like protein [Leishmania mexicana MHOM/GT/2001/U1103]CBZ23429.1 phosphatase-like protein [Leishmania mexicana MHOM/GT/2001/U1103]